MVRQARQVAPNRSNCWRKPAAKCTSRRVVRLVEQLGAQAGKPRGLLVVVFGEQGGNEPADDPLGLRGRVEDHLGTPARVGGTDRHDPSRKPGVTSRSRTFPRNSARTGGSAQPMFTDAKNVLTSTVMITSFEWSCSRLGRARCTAPAAVAHHRGRAVIRPLRSRRTRCPPDPGEWSSACCPSRYPPSGSHRGRPAVRPLPQGPA